MKKILLFILVLFSTIPYSWSQTTTEEADKLLNNALPNNEHGLSVLIVQDDKIIYEKLLGYADVETQREVNATTKFRIGSVTKQFTAAAILKLVEMNKMKLSDPLSKYISDFSKGDQVTIHHLLTHTSGIKSYTDETDFMETVEVETSEKDLIDKIKSLGYDFEPGDNYKYNNSAYLILGYLVEQVSGKKYEDFLSKHFFEPAGMENTGVYHSNKTYQNEAKGYSNYNGQIKPSINWDMSWAGGAGNMYSTAQDLVKWDQNLFLDKLISHESLKTAHTMVKLNDGLEKPYGYGWGLDDYKELQRIHHSGGLHGFLSYLGYYPTIDANIVVLSNASPPLRIVPTLISEDLLDIFFKEHLTQPKEMNLSQEELKKYVGKYDFSGNRVLEILMEDNKIFAQLTGQPKFEIFAKDENHFFLKAVKAEIKFNLTEADEVDYLTLLQNGMEMKSMKLDPSDIPAPPKEMTMTPEQFAPFAGEYNLNGAWVKVWEEEDKFYTQIQGQPKFQIYAKSDNRFFMKELPVEIEFNAESLTIYQAGREIKAAKNK